MTFIPHKLLDAVLVTGAGSSVKPVVKDRAFQATGFTSAGVGAVEVDVEVSNDNVNWIVLGTITLVLGTAIVTDGFTSDAGWARVRGNVKSISGTDAQVTLTVGL